MEPLELLVDMQPKLVSCFINKNVFYKEISLMKKLILFFILFALTATVWAGEPYNEPGKSEGPVGPVTSSLIPAADNTYDIGSTTLEWKDLWVDGTAHADTIDADSVDVTTVTDGNLPYMQAGAAGFGDSPLSTDGTDVVNSGAYSGTTVTTVASATPGISGNSSAQADPTETTFSFYANPTTTTDDAVISDFYWRLLGAGGTAGTMATIMWYDGSAQSLNVTGAIVNATATVSTTGPTDNVDVTGVNVVFIDTASNSVTIGGFVGGTSGQVIHLVRTGTGNDAILEYDESTGNQDIFLLAEADQTVSTYGGWTLICDGSNWYEVDN